MILHIHILLFFWTHLPLYLTHTAQHAHAFHRLAIWKQFVSYFLIHGNLALSQNLIHPNNIYIYTHMHKVSVRKHNHRETCSQIILWELFIQSQATDLQDLQEDNAVVSETHNLLYACLYLCLVSVGKHTRPRCVMESEFSDHTFLVVYAL